MDNTDYSTIANFLYDTVIDYIHGKDCEVMSSGSCKGEFVMAISAQLSAIVSNALSAADVALATCTCTRVPEVKQYNHKKYGYYVCPTNLFPASVNAYAAEI